MRSNKHAYLIVAHNNFRVLKVMLEMIDNRNNDIYLLIDKKTKDVNVESLKSVIKQSKVYVLNRININWGGYSQIDAVIRLLDEACKKDNYLYYHFMQGADLPIRSQDDIHKFFKENYGKEFIEFSVSNTNSQEFAKYKKCYYHFFTDNKFFRTNKIVKLLNHSIASIQRYLKIMRKDEIVYHGSALFSITHEFATYLISLKDVIRKEYKYTLACDEVFIQTIIMNSKFKNNINHYEEKHISNARYIDWENKKRNSPNSFKLKDYDKLINLPHYICFARKFEETVDFQIVEKIRDYVMIK
ncbi:beta-1,6-N-acetylglucosaminyltransferase [Clostridium tertium]|uniref:beta-1,6-N-acetylglucosaminyltransferase n=1 Tax=Clostridium tertium TaxID=1559 RepID=UPI002330F44D|nr:beta-1,6-N-acetylglucosaminyltransferase [Clostridium tertium]MDB1921722.1 beta-1,6-N-acetylglucosaminyltransferase [Clostridium tertium]MDB1924925.1 beta-1,6-N-acetylglucosaminyltransferase [Clostridium tertium]MDB1929564.1 beta-1,6-N-acetylglucosaminyltransferase [Clostridium tertium]